MKKRFYDFENLDFTNCREITGNELYKINGGERVENSNEAVAQAQVGDTIERDDGSIITLNQGDINWAQAHCNSNNNNPTDVSDLQTAQTQNVNTSDQITPTSGSFTNTTDNHSSLIPNIKNSYTQELHIVDSLCGDENNTSSLKPLYKLPEKNTIKQSRKSYNTYEESNELYFDTIVEAARDFGLKYNDDSIRDNVEIGTYIRKRGEKYFYDTPVGGEIKIVHLHHNSNENDIVALAHTHGRYIERVDEFHTTALEPSPEDYDNMNKNGLSFFTFTPDGNMFYSGINGDKFQYLPIFASDPACPKRLNTINAYEMSNNYYIKNGGTK